MRRRRTTRLMRRKLYRMELCRAEYPRHHWISDHPSDAPPEAAMRRRDAHISVLRDALR